MWKLLVCLVGGLLRGGWGLGAVSRSLRIGVCLRKPTPRYKPAGLPVVDGLCTNQPLVNRPRTAAASRTVVV